MSFRKEAQATLKSLRDQGYSIRIKLNAKNVELAAELKRIEEEMMMEAQSIQQELDDLKANHDAVEIQFPDEIDSDYKETNVAGGGVDINEVAKTAVIRGTAQVAARVVHELKVFDYKTPALQGLCVFLQAVLYSIQFLKAVHSTTVHTFKAMKKLYTSPRVVKARVLLREFCIWAWDNTKMTEQGSNVFETVFCLK